MKSIKKIITGLMLAVPLMFTSCEEDLAEMNIDPHTSHILSYDAQFLFVQGYAHSVHGQREMSFYGTVIQQLATLGFGTSPGDKYWNSDDNLGQMYTASYTNTIKNVVDLIARTADDPELSNYHNIARIMKVYAFQRLTDNHGDIPYSEAGLGFAETNFTPVYDTQESIYMDMLNELITAIPALDASGKTYNGSDSYYAGDIQQWKKLGYSLMLRLAMRMQKVDPALARQWVNTAVDGGVFTGNDDNQVFHHSSWAIPNPISRSLFSSFHRFRVAETFIDMLVDTDDPRLEIFAEPYSGNGPIVGLPNGLDQATFEDPANNPLGLTFDEFAYFRRTIWDLLSAPSIGVNYSEVLFLQAEAVLRGWITGDATALYEAGVVASMTIWDIYTGITVPDAAAIQAYLTANPFDGSYEMIGNQMYLTNWRSFIEGFAHWRRTGFPVLTPVNYPGNVTGGVIPRRCPLDGWGAIDTGVQYNQANYDAMVARQGPDSFTTRVWWDVE
ncbi:MAG: SusD/RagB family nutrient-binding outer membrane lipoprotein [Bacteroidota bacterium]|nr:SusD/RagB family nutrient-binding outer membrane lipoprotein [Bacteroidota bacterium]